MGKIYQVCHFENIHSHYVTKCWHNFIHTHKIIVIYLDPLVCVTSFLRQFLPGDKGQQKVCICSFALLKRYSMQSLKQEVNYSIIYRLHV